MSSFRPPIPSGESELSKFVAFCHGASVTQLRNSVTAAETYAASRGVLVSAHQEARRPGSGPGPSFARALAQARASGSVLLFAPMGDLGQDLTVLKLLAAAQVIFVATDDPLANEAALPLMLRLAETRAAHSARIKEALDKKRKRLQALTPEQRHDLESRGERARLGGNPIDDAGRRTSALNRQASAEARRQIVDAALRRLLEAGTNDNAELAVMLNELGIMRPSGRAWTGVYVSRAKARLKPR